MGPQDGTAPSLWVSLDGTLSFSYSDPTINPWQCADGAETCEPPTGDLPSEDEAIDALRSLLVSAGRDPATFEFTSETYEGAVTRSAQAWPVVDGQRIDQAWTRGDHARRDRQRVRRASPTSWNSATIPW